MRRPSHAAGRARARALAAGAALAIMGTTDPARAASEDTVLVVAGAAGEPTYATAFAAAVARWQEAARKGGARAVTIGLEPAGGAADRDRLREALAREAGSAAGTLWLVLVGHGTFDGRAAKFNLRGPDVSAEELAAWLRPVRRPLVVINTASASAPFLKPLTGAGRAIVTATKTGREQNATRLNAILAETIADPAADLDKDGQTSLLEAFLMASKRVGAGFDASGLLATEHALLEDNGDGLGTPASFFQGLRPTKKAAGEHAPDGYRAHQIHLVATAPEQSLPASVRNRRDELELQVLKLRDARAGMSEDAYYARLEALATELARLYERAEKR